MKYHFDLNFPKYLTSALNLVEPLTEIPKSFSCFLIETQSTMKHCKKKRMGYFAALPVYPPNCLEC